jgi:hypothetical protein
LYALLMLLMTIASQACITFGPVSRGGLHADAIDRTRRHAQITAGAPIVQNGVHAFIGADDGIHRAGSDTDHAAYAVLLIDDGDLQGFMNAATRVQRQNCRIQCIRQKPDARIAPGGAAIDRRKAVCQGFGIR